MIEGLIYDRTQADCSRALQILQKLADNPTADIQTVLSADEYADYMAGLRGCYNESDTTRVNAAAATIAEMLNNAGYKVEFKPLNLQINNSISTQEWAEYISNIRNIRDALIPYSDMPNDPLRIPNDDEGINIDGANDIERTLTRLSIYIDWMILNYKPSGTFKSGMNAWHLPIGRGKT